ncbi:MAG TPA: hypothetical protein VGQ57_12020 [Polyangiaceae bacterium]|nr:hypothetical protein [Polyangiaceae bacterium]
MLKPTGLCVLVAIAGAAACGSPSTNDFSGPTGQSGHATGGASGTEPTGGGPGAGGSSQGGDGASTTGGSATGGSSTGGTGTGGDSQGLGGVAGDLMASGGTSGDTATGGTDTGGTGTDTGGTGMTTGGTGTDTGGTGTTTGGSAGMPPMGGAAGMGPSCEELAMQYTDALKAAQVCNPNSGKDQCSSKEYSDLTCGCPVSVNPDNADAVAELEQLRKDGVRCRMACPAIACVAPGDGTCTRDMGGTREMGHCTNTPALPAAP